MGKLLAPEMRLEAIKLGFTRHYSSTQSDLQDWLLSEKNIKVEVITACTGKFLDGKIMYCYQPSITIITPISNGGLFFSEIQSFLFKGKLPFGTTYEAPMGYDETLFYGLKEGLNLIKKS